ncbi:MAG: hypothetical protein IK020_02145 [Clostridiales bacterium]|nr:hypothetical protein [Clostridiales bacterium]
MAGTECFYNGVRWSLDRVSWTEKTGVCKGACRDHATKQWCPLFRGRNTCHGSNLVEHTCKHVVFGNEDEKQFFRDAMESMDKDGTIPSELRSDNDPVVQNYKSMSEKVVREPVAVNISGTSNGVSLICNGDGDLAGMVGVVRYDHVQHKDPYTGAFEKDERRKEWGIVSAFFNNSSGDLFALYRLVHQRYYEHLDKGQNVSPVLKFRWDAKRKSHDLDNLDVSEVETAFAVGPLLYQGTDEKNHASGVVFSYFLSKYPEEKLGTMDAFLRGCAGKKEEAKKCVLFWDKVWLACLLLGYIRRISSVDFKKSSFYGDEEYTLIDAKEWLKTGEVRKNILERMGDAFVKHYQKEKLDNIADFISENEMVDDETGSIVDYSCFTVVNELFMYFMVLYEVWKWMAGAFGEEDLEVRALQPLAQAWVDSFEECKKKIRNRHFQEWVGIFNDIFRFKKSVKEMKAFFGLK